MGLFDTKRKKTLPERVSTAFQGDFSSETNTNLGKVKDFVDKNKETIATVATVTAVVAGGVIQETADTGVNQTKKIKNKG